MTGMQYHIYHTRRLYRIVTGWDMASISRGNQAAILLGETEVSGGKDVFEVSDQYDRSKVSGRCDVLWVSTSVCCHS